MQSEIYEAVNERVFKLVLNGANRVKPAVIVNCIGDDLEITCTIKDKTKEKKYKLYTQRNRVRLFKTFPAVRRFLQGCDLDEFLVTGLSS